MDLLGKVSFIFTEHRIIGLEGPAAPFLTVFVLHIDLKIIHAYILYIFVCPE